MTCLLNGLLPSLTFVFRALAVLQKLSLHLRPLRGPHCFNCLQSRDSLSVRREKLSLLFAEFIKLAAECSVLCDLCLVSVSDCVTRIDSKRGKFGRGIFFFAGDNLFLFGMTLF